MKLFYSLQKLLNDISQWRQRRRSIADLNMMPDYLLADIGIARHEIADAVNNLPTKHRIEKTMQISRTPVVVTGKHAAATSGI